LTSLARRAVSDPIIAAFPRFEPTAPALYERSDFYEWGSLDAADASEPRSFVVVRGHLAQDTLEENRAAHDAVASGGEAGARAAGDVGHIVFLGAEDQREFLAIDIWADATNLEALYGNPDFQAAFGILRRTAHVGVYQSTDGTSGEGQRWTAMERTCW
jgi:hypothetical protein